ncbi:MAG: hypothetical protein Q8O76_02770, partial [Chloroflexota bacterium]|nr:hypothetical protein [Chloroflexota bacterium]
MRLERMLGWWAETPSKAFGLTDVSNGKRDPHARTLYQTHAAFRFFAFAIGLGLFFVPKAGAIDLSEFLVLVGLAGAFNVSRILLPPFARWRSPVVEAVFLAAEALVAVLLVLKSGGLDSPFLVYSFVP